MLFEIGYSLVCLVYWKEKEKLWVLICRKFLKRGRICMEVIQITHWVIVHYILNPHLMKFGSSLRQDNENCQKHDSDKVGGTIRTTL